MRTAHTWGVGQGWGLLQMRTVEAARQACPGVGGRAQNQQSRRTKLCLKEVGGRPVPTQLGEEAALSGLVGPTFLPTPLLLVSLPCPAA